MAWLRAVAALCIVAVACADDGRQGSPVATCEGDSGGSRITSADWGFLGPYAYYAADDDYEVHSAGAVNAVALLPGNASTGSVPALIATVNGGVWATADIKNSPVAWTPALDASPVNCASMTTVVASPHKAGLVYAGCGGSTSSEQGVDWNVLNTGDWGGVMVSTDSGATWAMTTFPSNYFVTDILPLANGDVLVSCRSHFFNASEGGVWRQDAQSGAWTKVLPDPVFNMLQVPQTSTIFASKAMDVNAVVYSTDGGSTWVDYSKGLSWGGKLPFYSCLAVSSDGTVLFLGALTVNMTNTKDTFSGIFYLDSQAGDKWQPLRHQPQSMDQDRMPKDRMALLVDPHLKSTLYVAGNAGSVVYRVDWRSGEWASMVAANDTSSGAQPHVDCRNFAWEATSGSLLLVSDGGIFERTAPSAPGGSWISKNGDLAEMEVLSASWDAAAQRFAAAAQDNSVQISPPGCPQGQASVGIISGDGTLTAADNTQKPPRLFGCRQFLGSGLDDSKSNGQGDDADVGLAFVQGNLTVPLSLEDFGFEDPAFPYFVSVFRLNAGRPTTFTFWANGSTDANRDPGFFALSIPAGTTNTSQLKAPTPVFSTPWAEGIIDFQAGVDGDPDAIVGMGTKDLFVYRTNETQVTKPLPVAFADPIVFSFDADGQPILGPVSHGKTTSLALSVARPGLVAVTGWTDVMDNSGAEGIWISRDWGSTWVDVFGNLTNVTGTAGKVRPSGLLFVEGNKTTTLLTGTTRGVYGTVLVEGQPPAWKRIGDCTQFPLVLTLGLSYEPADDTILAATMGRGVYLLPGASKLRLD